MSDRLTHCIRDQLAAKDREISELKDQVFKLQTEVMDATARLWEVMKLKQQLAAQQDKLKTAREALELALTKLPLGYFSATRFRCEQALAALDAINPASPPPSHCPSADAEDKKSAAD